MKQVRRSVFETNSSSTHSVTIRHREMGNCILPIQEDGYIHTYLAEYGWEREDYTGQADKLSYLVTMLAEKNGRRNWWREEDTLENLVKNLMETDEFKRISKEIGVYAKCHGVVIDPSEGYIDHQSHEDYDSVQDFLDDYGMSASEFVFGSGTTLHTDNDNY